MNKHEPPPKAREAAVFKSNRSQAIRIPKDLAFPEDVKKVTITPAEGRGPRLGGLFRQRPACVG